MKEKQWVQHISGQGEKWELQKYQDPEWPSWVAPHTVNGGGLLYLPKSEYRLCDPPEVWRDVTEACEMTNDGNVVCRGTVLTILGNGYRLRKVTLYAMARPIIDPMQREVAAFIVEQKVTE